MKTLKITFCWFTVTTLTTLYLSFRYYKCKFFCLTKLQKSYWSIFFKKGESCEVRKIKPHEKINNIRRKYLNLEGNLEATYRFYLNSLNNSPLTSFDEWLKQNYYFTNMQEVNLPSSSSVGDVFSDFQALAIHILSSNNSLVSA